MSIKNDLTEVIKTLFIPEIEKIQIEMSGIKGTMLEMSHRLSDMNNHIIRLDKRIDSLEQTLNQRIDSLEHTLNQRIDETNQRIDNLYSVIVRREEHESLKVEIQENLKQEILKLREDIEMLKEKVAS